MLLALHQAWPSAPLLTAVYNPSTALWAKDLTIKSSWLQHFPLAKTHHELYPWLTSLAFESFNFDDWEVVISVTSAEAKAIITKPHTLHLCYCLTPTRYLWSHQKDYLAEPQLGQWLQPALKYLQSVDLINSQRPDVYLAISQTVQARIKKYYHRQSVVIYPPVDTSRFSYRPAGDYFLVVSRLTQYKKVDLAIKACNRLKENLVIVGTGRELSRLKQISGPTIKFLGQVTDEALISIYQNCRALIMPQEEDFGIVSVEAQASAKPVIAYQKGGAVETVTEQTGIFFNRQTVDSVALAVKQFYSRRWDRNLIQAQAKKFDRTVFIKKIKELVNQQWLYQKSVLKF